MCQRKLLAVARRIVITDFCTLHGNWNNANYHIAWLACSNGWDFAVTWDAVYKYYFGRDRLTDYLLLQLKAKKQQPSIDTLPGSLIQNDNDAPLYRSPTPKAKTTRSTSVSPTKQGH